MSPNLRVMKTNFTYDFLIIGGGLSACVFASNYLQRNLTKKIALIEAGRQLGGRSSTRISKRFKGWELNHGAPNFNIKNIKDNHLLRNYIDQLLVKLLAKQIELNFEVFFFELFQDTNDYILDLASMNFQYSYGLVE